jgi:GNAT superfamily N-acetyltransferase
MVEQILQYTPDKRADVEAFRAKTFAEGNTSLDPRKFDPDSLLGAIWLAYSEGELVSLSAAELSHYTEETDVVRKCRYHILKSHRHGRYGFKFLQVMIPWCQDRGYKLLYWTHDVNNIALNALYQRKRRYAFSDGNDWFENWPYTELKFESDMLFKTGSMLQFVYSIYIDKNFVWRPKFGNHMIYYNHNGQILNWDDIKDVVSIDR